MNSKYLSFINNIHQYRLIFSNASPSCSLTICNVSDALYDKSVSNKVVTIKTTLEPFFNNVIIVASCNGLVCFYDDNNYKNMFIWNPTTRICKKLSSDYFLCNNCYGFGYDESTDDYKFLSLYESRNPITSRYSFKTRIYSLKTGMWNNTIGDFPYRESGHHADGKYSNGALHWVGDRWRIISFDLSTEKYGQVLQPEYDGNKFILSLGALGKELCMLCYYHERRSDIWVMNDYGVKESWTKLFSVSYMPDRGAIPRYNTPLFISKDGKILFEDNRKLFVYDSKNGSCFEIENFEIYDRACIFVESLVSPMPTPWLD